MLFSFFGAAPDTGNLGVSALCYATIINIVKQDPNAKITVFDHGRGERMQNLKFEGNMISFQRQGAVYSRRFYRPENLRLMKLLGVFGGLGNPGIRTIAASDAVLDISGGDSFTDLYGSRRFKSVLLPKLIALQQKKPLILLPQTYGPFATKKCRREATQVVKKAKCAWARDNRSFKALQELLGSSFDSNRHNCGVDMAFGLPAIKPANLSQSLDELLTNNEAEKIGINISGLIYNNPLNTKKQFHFKADYNQVIVSLIHRFLAKTDVRIALVPHVVTPDGHYESDIEACKDVMRHIEKTHAERVTLIPAYNNPCEIKWIISKFKWFCGTRMHATIAALSSGIPTSAISYSPKTLGVFETCGQGSHVADPQQMNNEKLLDCLWQSWRCRKEAREEYARELPAVMAQVQKQTLSILNYSQNN